MRHTLVYANPRTTYFDESKQNITAHPASMPTLTTLPAEILHKIVQNVNEAYNIYDRDPTIFSLLYVNQQLRDIAIDVYTKEDHYNRGLRGRTSGPILYPRTFYL